MAAINIKRAEFHGEWNYTISPKTLIRQIKNARYFVNVPLVRPGNCTSAWLR